jgi:hypothetical protein
MPLQLGQVIDTAALAGYTAGGTDFIRTQAGVVRGIAIRRDLNPEAPEVVLVGAGPQRQDRARRYFESRVSVPAFVKRDVDAWEYIGNYRAVDYSESKDAIAKYTTGKRRPGTVAGVLLLEPETTQAVVAVGGGLPDSKTRKAIEQAAIDFVSSVLEDRKYQVEDRQPENQGYDLLATKGSERLFVEVKGTDAPEPRFYLTRNEWNFGQREGNWRLFVVCTARTAPSLHEYSAAQVSQLFQLDPLAWQCTPK